MKTITRRSVIKMTSLAAGTAIVGQNNLIFKNENREIRQNKMKIIVVGAHPDDPETIAGGTMALFAQEGHEVIAAYLTRGEAGIPGKSNEEAAIIRTEEAQKACKILNCRPEFLGQVDGACEITPKRYTDIFEFLNRENPDLVITHWPIDTHRDHRICSNLVLDTWFHTDRKFELWYAEAMTGVQSQNFTPTDYLDISSVISKKHMACFAHVSQKLEVEYPTSHARMEVFRGMEHHCEFAEAFVKLAQCKKQSY